ncbi:FtsW/RodA/SpoVE family cell cycle protein [Prosthecobacter vanneervenii]|uniref:Rod shape determining protein RodA n=1 Tax=Prosthecobacter vanneervenii TaxID=48466 RepID=A0A7W7Y9V4_9BACT|nr:FtsW/RodA/SpoVE family cell cycle protein [Prosthecobacter vanneervenii]MBB5031965.1 rod shape determining protein RodA [Prosthecobacter vanneervenii]
MTPLFKKFLGMNWLLVLNIAALIVFGVYAIYNASAYKEDVAMSLKYRDQIRWVLIGLPFFFAASLIDYKWVRWACVPMYLAGIGGLVAVLAFGVEIGGNKAWIKVGSIMVQPSQFAIMSGILILGVIFGELPRMLPVFRRPWLRIMMAGMVAGVPALMVIKEDLGSGLVWGPVFLTIMLVGSIPFRYLITLLLCVVSVVPLVYVFALKPYQQARIQSTWYMLTNQLDKVDLQNEGWVAKYLQIAVSTGGLEGKGPESKKVPDQTSIHRTFFPHESINDFIFGVICEEFGFRGALLVLSGMALLLLQGVFVAFCARDQLGRLIVVGVVAMFFVHTFQNAGMNLVMLPVIGLPMPFVSYGGTFVVVTLFLMGMVQSVWVHRNISAVKKKRSVNGPRRDEEDEEE